MRHERKTLMQKIDLLDKTVKARRKMFDELDRNLEEDNLLRALIISEMKGLDAPRATAAQKLFELATKGQIIIELKGKK